MYFREPWAVGSVQVGDGQRLCVLLSRLTCPLPRVVNMKDDPYYWYLALTVLCLGFEGVFTLAIKETQEWKFFCPSVFLYLARSVRQCDTLFRCLDIRVPQSQY